MSAELKWRTEMGEQSEESILSGAKRASLDVEIEGRGADTSRVAPDDEISGVGRTVGPLKKPSVNQPERTRFGG